MEVETEIEWVWTDVGVMEEVEEAVGNGSSCLNSARGDGKREVHHTERSKGLAVVVPSELSWVAGRTRDRLISWMLSEW